MRKALTASAFVASCTLLLCQPCKAKPTLDDPVRIGDVVVYPDNGAPEIFYLHPAPLVIASDKKGQPDIHLSLTYYVGSRSNSDENRDDVSWRLSVGLERLYHSAATRRAIVERLKARFDGNIVLRNLPVKRIPVQIIYVPADTPDQVFELDSVHVAESDSKGIAGSSWTSRTLNMPLERVDGNNFRAAVENDGAVMSLSYQFVSEGVVRHVDPEAEPNMSDNAPIWKTVNKVYGDDALRVELDTGRYPDFLRVVDLDSLAPPGYPGITVICSDYLQEPEDIRFEETEVIFEAEGVTGNPIRVISRFPLDDPDVSLQQVGFKFAVRVDRPFRYQVRAYGIDGQEFTSDWTTVSGWNKPVYVSTADLFDI